MDTQTKITPNLRNIIAGILGVIGIGRIWLWSEGYGNDSALYLGIILTTVSAIMLWGFFKKSTNA